MLNRTIRYILTALVGILIFGGIAAAVLAGRSDRQALKCTGVRITVLDSLENDFVSAADVRKFLDKEYGGYMGKTLDSLDLCRIESIIDGRSAVLKSEAFVTKDGILHIDVTQRKPIVRFQKAEGGFYADAEGFVFPLQSSYASYVQIVDGAIPVNMKSGHKGQIEDPKQKEWFDKVMNVVRYIENDRTWKERIVQIHVSKEDGLILIPREGKERFIFGQPTEINEKFEKLKKYYTAIAPVQEPGTYRSVSLEFDGQIVCRK